MIWLPAARALRVEWSVVGLHGRLAGVISARVRRWLIAVAMSLGVAVAFPSLAVAGAAGTISFSVGSNPTVGVPLSITVSGAIEVAGKLTVYMVPGSKCPSEANVYGQEPKNASIVGSSPVSAGSFSQTYSVTPASLGDSMLCGYLDEVWVHEELGTKRTVSESESDGMGSAVFDVRPPTPHLTALTVTVRSHAGKTAAKPGHTELLVHATGEAELRLALKRRGHAQEDANSSATSSHTFLVPWSCSTPAAIYAWMITASDTYGVTLTRSGSFRVPLSAARCHALRSAEQRRHRKEGETEARVRREERENNAAGRREGGETKQEDERVRKDQRAYCERVLGGQVEQVYNGAMIPAIPSEIETECYAHLHNYTLRGDPPVVVA